MAKTKSTSTIRCKAKLLRPASPGKGRPWSFLILPKSASSKLATRSMTTVEGTINDCVFHKTLSPDGDGSHWLKVSDKLRIAAGAEVGDMVSLQFAPSDKELEPTIPTDLRTALADTPEAKATWKDITTIARRDWVLWITTAKKADTRTRRIATACDMLANDKRRPCCFDRSGVYSKSLGAPEAAS